MINRRFTFRENLLLTVLCIFFAAGILYVFVRKPLCAEIENILMEQAAVEDELEIQRHMAERKESMKRQMEQEPGKNNGELGSYNNLTNEIEELSRILAAARCYDLKFSEEKMSEDIVYRDIFISYQVDSYEQAKDILEAVENGKYCCLVKDVELMREEGGPEEEGGRETVYGNLLVTYYEAVEKDDVEHETGDGQNR